MRLRHVEKGTRAAARAGFTLMELLVVVAILLVLVGVAVPTYMRYLDDSKLKVAKSDCAVLAGELTRYAVSNGGEYPIDMMPSFEALAAFGYIKRSPVDPWGQPYQWTLRPLGIDGTQMTPVVWSSGPNKVNENGGGDDITSE